MKFLGACIGVQLSDRGPQDRHQMVTIMVEDDEVWHSKLTVSSYWLNEAIQQLQAAKAYLEANAGKSPDGYGYVRKP